MSTPNPPEFSPETQFRVSWEMPPAFYASAMVQEHGETVWQRMPADWWTTMDWQPTERVTDDYEAALNQFRQLSEWAEGHAQPIRNVKLEWRQPPQWVELDGVTGGPEPAGDRLAPAILRNLDIPAGGDRFA